MRENAFQSSSSMIAFFGAGLLAAGLEAGVASAEPLCWSVKLVDEISESAAKIVTLF
jgi:hypothetical protein